MLTAPNNHALFVMLLTVVALVLFSRKNLPLETTSLYVLAALLVTFTLFPYSEGSYVLNATAFFAGFGHEALVAVSCLMIIGHGLVRTGALEPVGRWLTVVWRKSPRLALLMTMLLAAFFSAFVNNTPIVILLLPILVTVSLRTSVETSGVLMPVGFATLLGGMTTTIGTSTNLLVVSVATDLGLDRIGMFDFLIPAGIAGGIGILYLWLIAPLLMPKRKPTMMDTSPRIFNARLLIPQGSFADGKTLSQVVNKLDGAMTIRNIRRGKDAFIRPLPDAIIRVGDQLAISDTPERLKEFERTLGGSLYTRNVQVDEDHPLSAEDQQLAQIVVTEGSHLANRTLRESQFKDRYQLVVLALHRSGRALTALATSLLNTRIHSGDVILVQGAREKLAAIRREARLLMLDATTDLPFTRRAPVAIAILVGVVTCAAIGITPIAISAVVGVLLMLATRTLGWRDIGHALSLSIILVIVVSVALAHALQATGGADFIATVFLMLTADLPPAVIVSLLMLVVGALTNVVSNNAAAIIGTPIAVNIAARLQLPVEVFVLAVLFGANLSFITPMAYQTNLLVMNTGGYHFSDFVRIGVPLFLIVWLTLSFLLPYLYGI